MNIFSDKKSVLLLGGTGAIGLYLANECVRLGFNVYITTRNSNHCSSEKIKYIIGDSKDLSFLRSLNKIGHFDSVIDFMVYETVEFRKNIDVLLSLSSQYVYVSSYRVYSDTNGELITEDTPRLIDTIDDIDYLSTDEYALAKARQEDILMYEYKCYPWTIIRPSITYSTNRFQFGCLEANTIIPRSLDKVPVPISDEMLNKKTTMTWAGDSSKMIASLIGKPKAINEIFNVLTEQSVTWKEVADIYKKELGMISKVIPHGDYLMLGINPWQIKHDRMYDRTCSNKKIVSFFNINKDDFIKLEDGLRLEIKKKHNST